jgi:hypothetical protein
MPYYEEFVLLMGMSPCMHIYDSDVNVKAFNSLKKNDDEWAIVVLKPSFINFPAVTFSSL